MDSRTDEQLMLALGGGELAAFDTLFRRHYATVHALCARLTSSGEAADDLAQETFLRILRHRSTFRGDALFTTWMYSIARNVCINYMQSVKRSRLTATQWVEARAFAGGTAGEESGDQRSILAEAFERLPSDKREVLVLCRYHDLPFEEVGKILGCSAGAARVRAHRALAALRELCVDLERSDERRRRGSRAGS